MGVNDQLLISRSSTIKLFYRRSKVNGGPSSGLCY